VNPRTRSKAIATFTAAASAQHRARPDGHAIPYRSYAKIDDLFQALERRQIDAVIHDAPILAYYTANKGRGKVRLVGGLLRPEKYGIAVPQGSTLVEPINRAILRLRERGIYERILRNWFGDAPR
jgi:polar amino acid transport system substrate-binding protein